MPERFASSLKPASFRAARVGVLALLLAFVALANGPAVAAPAAPAATGPRDVVIHASQLPKAALSEFEVWKDAASPGGQLVGTPNSGGNLDPPPEDDPNVTFKLKVQGGVPYRAWFRMKVGAPKGVSKANRLWVQFTSAVDATGKEVLKPKTASYLTAQGPTQPGWTWVACNGADAKSSLVTFRTSGEVMVRVQAGAEGVGFDQFILSPARFLEKAPTDAVVVP